jgi:hypothetical protein
MDGHGVDKCRTLQMSLSKLLFLRVIPLNRKTDAGRISIRCAELLPFFRATLQFRPGR